MKATRWVITYIVMASVGLWMALFMSLKFMTPGHAQTPSSNLPQKIEPPSPGDLPPEFLEGAQGATVPNNGLGNGKIPPPPSHPPELSPTYPEATQPPVPSADLRGPQPPAEDALQPQLQDQPELGAPLVIPQFASDDQYTFDPTGRRDPFKAFKSYRPASTTTTKVIDLSDPLQKWDLDRFSVVAIMWEIRLPKAMVKDPDGKMYMIGKNTKIGRNSGQVVAIREGEVVVVEAIENEGVQTKEVKILELKK